MLHDDFLCLLFISYLCIYLEDQSGGAYPSWNGATPRYPAPFGKSGRFASDLLEEIRAEILKGVESTGDLITRLAIRMSCICNQQLHAYGIRCFGARFQTQDESQPA